jgi:hypothetical protein
MNGANYISLLLSSVIAFIVSMFYYRALAKQMKKLGAGTATMKKPDAMKIIEEVLRNFILSAVLLYFIVHLAIPTVLSAGALALIFWLGFPFILFTGSIMYEKVPMKLAAIHAGDWLIKLVIICAILQKWH